MALVIMVVVVLVTIIVSCLLEFLGHWWKSHTLGKVREWINKTSLFLITMIERAAFTEFALTGFSPILAWYGLVVGVNGAKSSLTEVLGKWIIWLS